ncbi:hypothetical protein [Allosphingosinicella sp.]|uniref:hypothetical protein n=1 Tax=Allosphingosinicella sp. TaxID=2823234 RepID=UPI003783E2F8
MQRVRIGLTGLASVFLAVLLAAVFTGKARQESQAALNNVAATGPGAANQTASPPEEPLATLGLTPSNPDSNGAGSTAPAAPPAGRR